MQSTGSQANFNIGGSSSSSSKAPWSKDSPDDNKSWIATSETLAAAVQELLVPTLGQQLLRHMDSCLELVISKHVEHFASIIECKQKDMFTEITSILQRSDDGRKLSPLFKLVKQESCATPVDSAPDSSFNAEHSTASSGLRTVNDVNRMITKSTFRNAGLLDDTPNQSNLVSPKNKEWSMSHDTASSPTSSPIRADWLDSEDSRSSRKDWLYTRDSKSSRTKKSRANPSPPRGYSGCRSIEKILSSEPGAPQKTRGRKDVSGENRFKIQTARGRHKMRCASAPASYFCTAQMDVVLPTLPNAPTNVVVAPTLNPVVKDQEPHDNADSTSAPCRMAEPVRGSLSLEGADMAAHTMHSTPTFGKASFWKQARTLSHVQKHSEESILEPTAWKLQSEGPSVNSMHRSGYSRFLRFFYGLWGITCLSSGWRAKLYRRLILFTVALCIVPFLSDLTRQPQTQYENLAHIAFTISSLVSLLSLSRLEIIGTVTTSPFERYANQHGFLTTWIAKGMRHILFVGCAWLLRAVFCLVRCWVLGETFSAMVAIKLFAAIFETGVYLALVHSMCHMLIFLKLSLDAFTVSFYATALFTEGFFPWNIFVSVMHEVSARIDWCFLAVQTSAMVSFLCYSARVLDMIIAAPTDNMQTELMLLGFDLSSMAVVVAVTFSLLAKAVNITESCAQLPQLVNSLQVTPDTALNSERDSLVNFIARSQAGFRVKGTQLNATFLMNYCYLCGAIVCGIFTTGLSYSRS